jgi:hypothetical protein
MIDRPKYRTAGLEEATRTGAFQAPIPPAMPELEEKKLEPRLVDL